MSRVVYTNTQSTPEQEQLRATHGVRVIADAEEGTGVNALPAGVYGFTYAPALESAPLFITRRFRSFETHKLRDGQVILIGFVTPADAEAMASSADAVEITLQPEPDDDATMLARVPYSRIRQHRQYAVRSGHGITLQVAPAPVIVRT